MINTLKQKIQYHGQLFNLLSFVPMLCMAYIIFSFSAQNADESCELSYGFGYEFISGVCRILKLSFSSEKIAQITYNTQYLLRKCAHMTEYFVFTLTVILPLYVNKFKAKQICIFAFIISVMYASLDEFHQTFVPGRSGQISDVFIDSIGIAASVFLFHVILSMEKAAINKNL